jgi:plasmid stabilization system protein ParE
MNFTIIWSEAAIRDLATIWMNATDRNAITQASSEIDRVLGHDPQHAGESRPGGQRVDFADPLGFRFEVVVDDLRVTIGAVWVTRQV